MSIKGGKKSVWFLIATAILILWELVASFDNNESTVPWTDLIVTYVPSKITFALILCLIVWLPLHFWRRYWRASRSRDTNT